METNFENKSYEEKCEIIKERMPDWQEDCAVYNDPEQESPFFMW